MNYTYVYLLEVIEKLPYLLSQELWTCVICFIHTKCNEVELLCIQRIGISTTYSVCVCVCVCGGGGGGGDTQLFCPK